MPSILTLEGHSASALADAGDNFLLAWLRRQNPLVAGVAVLGLSLTTGFVVANVATFAFAKAKKAMER